MALLVKIGADLSNFEKKIKKATKDIQYLGDKMSDAGESLTKKVTLPIIGVGVVSVKVGADFQSAMSEVAAISGATGDELKALEDKAKEMGKKTSKSAKESADALKYMSLAGWDSKTSIEALEPVLRLSEAGNIDLARTSDLVTDSMSSLGIEVEDLPKYLDQLAQTSRKSNTNIDALMEAMIVAGGTFKNLNVPIDEANALLGVLANRGKKGSEAGNSLNSIMVNLTSGAGQAGEALEELGISAFDSEGNFKGMTNVLMEVKEKTADLTEEQRTQYLAMIGGKTQLDTLQALLSGVGEEYVGLRADIADSNGTLNEMAAIMQDNLKGELTRLKSALEGVAIQIAEHLLPIVSKIIDKISVWVDWFANLDEGTRELIIKVALVVAAIGPLLIIVGKVIIIFGKLKAIAVILAGAIGAISWPVVAVIAAIAALIAIGVLLYKNWDKIKAFAINLWEAIKDIFSRIGQKISDVWSGVKETTNKVWEGIVNGIKGFINGIINSLNKMIGAMNKLSFDIPSWVPVLGGKKFGFNIPLIPQLATGTNYVPQDMLAVIHEGEQVVPKKYNPNAGGMGRLVNILVDIDSRTVIRALRQPLVSDIRVATGLKI